jgi:hypothetical protein
MFISTFGQRKSIIRPISLCETANAGPNQNICSGGPSGIKIGSPAIQGYIYSWTPITGLSNPNIADPFANPTTTTTYTLTMTPPNLLTNGDFENGYTGFSTDYGISPNGAGCPFSGNTGSIMVNPNPSNILSSWCAGEDHTPTGTNNMLTIDGSCSSNLRIWYASIPVNQNSNYYFGGWWSLNGFDYYNINTMPILRVRINGVDVIQNLLLQGTLYNQCKWSPFVSTSWNSGNSTNALIEIYDNNTNGTDNDFNLDDLFFGNCPPSTDNTTVTVLGAQPIINPKGPVEYYGNAENPVATGFTFTTNVTAGLQWYKDGQPIPNAFGQSYTIPFSTEWAEGEHFYSVGTLSCPPLNDVSFKIVQWGKANLTMPWANELPVKTSRWLCENSNETLRQFDLGSGTTYSWNITHYPTQISSLNPYNPNFNAANLTISGIPLGSSTQYSLAIVATANLNGYQKILDYDASIKRNPEVNNIYTVCGSNPNSSFYSCYSTSVTPLPVGGSGFDYENYDFGSGIVTSPIQYAGLNNITISGTNPLTGFNVYFPNNTVVTKSFSYNFGGCRRFIENININMACKSMLVPSKPTLKKSNETKLSEISVYPNPASSSIKVIPINIIGEYAQQIDIYTMGGILMKSIKLNLTDEIKLSEINQGVYLIKYTTNKQAYFKKVIIQK